MKALKLSPKRVSRSLVTIMVLTLIQVIGAPVFAPNSTTNSASAANASLVAGYSIDANATSASDVTSSMTLVGSPSYATTASSAGVGYYTFDATSTKYGYVTTSFPTASQNVSIFMWVYVTAEGTILSHSGQADPYTGYRLSMMDFTGGKFRVGLYTATGAQYISSNSVSPLQNWYYVGLTYDGATLRGYLNGDEFTETKNLTWNPAGRNAGYTNDYIHVGSSQGGTCFVSCPTAAASFRMAEFTLYLSQLTATQVNTNYLNTQSRFAPQATNPSSASILSNRTATFATTCSRVTSADAATSCGIQWQEWSTLYSRWDDIAGATTASYTTPIMSIAATGKKYRARVYDPGAGSPTTAKLYSVSGEATLTVTQPPGSETDTALTSSGAKYATIANSSPIIPGTVSTMTIEAWLRPSTTCDGASACTVISVNNSYLVQVVSGKISYKIGSGSAFCDGGVAKSPTTATIPSGQWSHLALVRVDANVKLYINGQLRSDVNSSCSPTTQAANSNAFFIGVKAANSEPFIGSIDEVRMWNTDRSSNAASDMHSNETSTSGLLNYWNFNEGTGTVAYNGVPGAQASTDLTVTDATTWDASVVSIETVTSTYTTRTFFRTYITASGSWKAPSLVPAFSALVVAGGGGGGWNSGGGGGGGGFLWLARVENTGRYSITVGAGGRGSLSTDAGQTPTLPPLVGQSSQFGSSTVAGGNPGGVFVVTTAGGASITTASGSSGAGGAGAATSGGTASPGGAGTSFNISGSATVYSSGGGGGGYNSAGGLGGSGAGDGGGVSLTTGSDALANRGGGGGASSAHVFSGNGGSGVVILRWITPLTPAYTKPVNAYLNVGMTETFTTNVAQDSATAILTRTFKWESTTPTANGVYTFIKQGTGAANAAFAWIPSDTSTSGSTYLYRLTVTDSDTAGLFITDSSTAYAVINQPLSVTGLSAIPKKINISRSETFTISLGTPTYRVSYTNLNSGISIDTSSATSVIFTMNESLTVGTYYETLTVIDSVSASVITPLVFLVAAPPSLVNTSDIVSNGMIFNVDFANSASYNRATGGVSDLSGSQKTVTTSGSPSFKEENLGFLKLETATNQFITAVGFTTLNAWTIDTYVRVDVKPTSSACLVSNQQNTASSTQNFNLCVDPGLTVWAGFFNGSLWTYKRTVETIAVGSWVHIVAEWSGLTSSASTGMLIWFNGVATTSTDSPTNATTAQPMTTNRVLIGRSSNSTVNNYANISVGYVRIYNRGLSLTEVTQNFNATKNRFAIGNVDLSYPSRKYGNLNTESLTATSGIDTRTVTLQVGDRSGIDWDTSTANTVKLTMFETLTVGTYYDTVTVTDSLGQSSYLPFAMTSNKADTLTITMASSVATVYSGIAPPNAPTASITGLVSTDSATVQTQYSGTYSDGTLTCAQGGTCVVGNIGPGGGTVFYVGSSEINTSTGVSAGGKYLEIAPANWNSSSDGGTRLKWSEVTTAVAGLSSGIGAGAENTRLISQALGSDATAANATLNLTFGGKTDWFMPSLAEMKLAYDSLTAIGINTITASQNFWVSEENPANRTQGMYIWSSNPASSGPYSKILPLSMRPIRAFSSSYFSTVTPTEVDTYNAKGTIPVFSSGALSNYQGVTYETSTLKITQANQNKLLLNLYGAIAGQPFALVTTGGSGNGAVTETVTAGGNATNCQVSNRILTNTNSSTDQKFCRVTVTKAPSRNYKSESLTADVYFMVFINNQPTGLVGSGSTIALNGKNSITVENPATNTAPMITGATLSGGVLTITGYGFGSSPVTIRFYRYVPAATMPTPTLNGSIYTIQVAVPAGAQDGPVEVITATGEAVTDDIDVTP